VSARGAFGGGSGAGVRGGGRGLGGRGFGMSRGGPYRLRVSAMLISLIVGTAAGLAPPLLAKAAIDEGIDHHDTQTLVLVVIVFLASALLVWLATYMQTYLVGWVGQRALADLRIRIFTHLQRQPVGFYENRPAGVLISRITNDVEALESLVTDSVVTLFQSGLTLLGAIGVLIYLDFNLALLTFCVVPFVAAGSIWFRLVSAGAFRRTRETIGAITAYLQETLSGIRVVRSFGQERRHEAVFAKLSEDNCDANMVTVRLNAAYFPTVEMLSGVALALIVLYGGYQAIEGHITAGTVVAFVATLSYLFEPIQQLSQLYTTYQSGMAALEKIFLLLDTKPTLEDLPDAQRLGTIDGGIRFENVSFGYKPDVLVLRDIELEISPGETVALVGATGAGKSTIAKLVARFYDPTRGSVLVDGHDLREVSSHSLRSQMGIVPQEAFLFAGSVAENISFGRPDANEGEIEAAAAAVGADEFISVLPSGYDTQIGERGGQLSAGQRQLVAFARPHILILDEATSNVDLHTEGRIEDGLRSLLSGRTAVVIAHRLSTIRQADRIVLLEDGMIAEEGTHEELIAAEGRYYELYSDWAAQAVT
jgi:ABC-type multidrug transport system fused ATPase/permease subunit